MSGRRAVSGDRGQALVEFTLVLPMFLLILMGTLEFGAAIDHRTAMAYAVREGARVGASLANGGTDPDSVDPAIIAAVQRGLTDPILMDNITAIDIFKASATGSPVGSYINHYDRDGTLIGTAGWPASSRTPGGGDSIGVLVHYDYRPTTPLAPLIGLFSGSEPPYTTLPMTDKSVMRLEPSP